MNFMIYIREIKIKEFDSMIGFRNEVKKYEAYVGNEKLGVFDTLKECYLEIFKVKLLELLNRLNNNGRLETIKRSNLLRIKSDKIEILVNVDETNKIVHINYWLKKNEFDIKRYSKNIDLNVDSINLTKDVEKILNEIKLKYKEFSNKNKKYDTTKIKN